ncbi:MAG: efflux RND transporter periplasmic adaptor subunit [Gallionella sp.]|jgi:RND family efflux transporter MFP subunit|nr:efflux RND transporter periplasmic adaptor subunit [Gallionella sp.]MCK9353952.1 efflux RND transporter periplasmic adaptor subunit [Gallionella sp.]
MNQKLLMGGALAVGVLGVVFFSGGKEPAPAAALAPAPASSPADASAAASAPVAAMLKAPEKKADEVRVLIAAEGESVLAAQMAGRIVSIGAKLGDRVHQGQAILRFDCDEQQARLNMARAEWDGAQKVYEAKAKLQSMQSASLLEVSQAAAEAEKFKAQIQLFQAQLRLCSINAPFSGRVTKLRIKPYESVVVGQQLVEVINDEKLKVQLNIPSLWLARVKAGNPFEVRIDETGKSYEAKVRRINGKVDAVSQSVEIEGELIGRPEDLLPGMSGVAIFPDAAPDAQPDVKK